MREKERERETSFFLRDATIARFARSDSLPRVKEREREREKGLSSTNGEGATGDFRG